MKAYIQTNTNGDCYNVNAFVAQEGFLHFGWEVMKFEHAEEITEADPEILVVGGIGNVRRRLAALSIPAPAAEIDYPEALLPFLQRRVWASTLQKVYRAGRFPVFVKPLQETKQFAGRLMQQPNDFTGILDLQGHTPVWCSEPIEFRTEWRCFIRYGQILDIRYYKGAWDSRIQLPVVQAAIAAFTGQPAAYALDFAVDAAGAMYLVEVNDGHSLGTYGMSGINYARFLSARWAQLTGTRDYLNF
jgi:hypothetical protein